MTETTEKKLTLLSLEKRVNEIAADLSALSDHVHNSPSGEIEPDLKARILHVLDKYYHYDQPS
jgi:hypothetical protein